MQKKDKIKKKEISQRGFTLVELAIVIAISGIMMSFMATALISYSKKNKIRVTKHRIEVIQESLEQYLRVNGNYPCVASRTLGEEDADFGREVTTTCNTGAFAGTVRNSGVRIGVVPARTLNLPDEYALDAWDNKFSYAVTEVLATKNQYRADGGRITVLDGAGNPLSVSQIPALRNDAGHFFIMSHGKTGRGGFTLYGTVGAICDATMLDGDNCDDDATFRSTIINSDTEGVRFFDDYTFFKGQTEPVFVMPSGAVLPFNLRACPNGWTAYTQAEARFVIGTKTAPITAEDNYARDTGLALILPTEMSFTLGTSTLMDEGTGWPPYVALLYCEKL